MFGNRYESPTLPQKNLPNQPPRLSFFISRNNGNIVPLIPADELPYSVRLSGVQRSMRMENTCGMQHVGNLPFTGHYFRLESETLHHAIDRNASHHKSNISITAKPFLAPDAMIRQKAVDGNLLPSSAPTADQAVAHQHPASTTATTWRRQGESSPSAMSTAQATIDAILASTPRPVRSILAPQGGTQIPSSSSRNGGGNTPESGDKVYCTHWIRHGECDYIQQGCRYKHEMPNKATLASIGFRTVPRWWQEKVAVQLGHSAIPIVGAGLKPSEWMKTKPGFSGSGESSIGNDSSDSDSDSDESEVSSDKGKDKEEKENVPNSSADTVKVIYRTLATRPMMEQPAKISTLTPAKKAITETPSTLGSPVLMPNLGNTSIRKPSLASSDLIEFSPAESTCETFATFHSACIYFPTTAARETNQEAAVSGATVTAPAPASPKIEKTQTPVPSSTSSPPRKVFVPAGESEEYHIAHARRQNAAVSSSTEVPAVKFTLGGGKVKEAVGTKPTRQERQKAKHSSTTKKRPTLANFSPSGKGLMASVHAPSSTPTVASNPTPTSIATSPSSSACSHQILSPTTIKLQQQKKRILKQAKKPKSGDGSRLLSSSSSTPDTRNDSTHKTTEAAKISAGNLGETKPVSKDGRSAAPNASRLRRPAGAECEDSRPRSKQAATKVVGGEAVRA